MHIDVSTLGRLAVFSDGRELAGITAQPIRAALLVYLAVERVATRDAVQACIWPDHAPGAARHVLSQTLYQLRQDVGSDWIDGAGNYLRATPSLASDATSFTDAVESGEYDAALELYRGPFLEGCHLAPTAPFQHWADRQRGRLARLHRKARRERVAQLVAAGDVEGALRAARGWVEIEPLEDEAQQHLMRLLAQSGARAEALRQYADFARLLGLEDIEPLPETKALADQLRAAEPAPLPELAVHAAAPASHPVAERIGPAAGPRRRRLRTGVLAGLGVALLVLAAGLLSPLAPWRGRAAAPRAIRSVAVLPFEHRNADSGQAYFADGIHEALITDLTRVSDLRVISRTSVLRYRGTDRPIPQIARELGVDAVIEGSVLKSGDSVRIEARLIDAATDRAVGTVSYVRGVRNVLQLLRDAARGIAGELAAATTRPGEPAGARPLVQADVYEAYLRARHLTHDLGADSWREATQLYARAIALDSGFAPAHAGLAQVHFLMGFFGMEPQSESWRRARAIALTATALDGGASEAHTVLGYVALYEDWDWDGAETALLEALRLDPNDALARHAYADLLMVRGRPEEGLRQVQLGREVDPLSPLMNGAVVGHLFSVRRFETTLAEVRRLRASLDRPGYGQTFLAASLWQLERYEDAWPEFRALWSADPGLLRAAEHGYAAAGPRGAMRAAADHAAGQWDSARGGAEAIASRYARAGDVDAALRWLERAYGERTPQFLHVVADPTYDPLRSDVRFHALLRRIGLPAGNPWEPAAEEVRR